MALTKRQKDFLDFLAGFLETHGYSPSYEEIAHGMDLASLATVHKHIMALETKHYLKRGFNQSRSLEIAPKYYQEQRQHRQMTPNLEVPLLGRIAAGAPVEALAGNDTLNFGDFVGDPNTFALKVRGESMIEAGIFDGDFVVVRQQPDAELGDVVVAGMPGDEATVKRLKSKGPKVVLEAANEHFEDLVYDASDVVIFGKVLSVLRRL